MAAAVERRRPCPLVRAARGSRALTHEVTSGTLTPLSPDATRCTEREAVAHHAQLRRLVPGKAWGGPVRVFFATDIHGSEVCWRKFLNAAAFYKADAVILGGDVTGKVMVPITEHNGYWQVVLGGETVRLDTREELAEAERQIRNRGSYPAVMPPDELTELSREEGAVDRRFSKEMISSLDRWLDMADGKLKGGEVPCLLNGGNDDIFEIDDVIDASPCVTFGEGRLIDLGGFHLVSMGWTNPTPWNTFREAPEEELAAKIEAVTSQVPDMGRAIFNFHAPPYGSGLDEAPALDA